MKTRLLNLFSIIFLLGCLFNSCSDNDGTLLPEKQTYVKYTLKDSAFVMYKSLQGTNNGGIESKDTTYFDEWFLDSKSMYEDIKESSFTFVNNTDSVFINGIMYLQCHKQMYQWIVAHVVGYKYKFEDDQFMIFYDDVINDISGGARYVDWLTIGYGDKDKFSIFQETKVIYGTLSGSSHASPMQFIAPSTIRENENYNWSEFFNVASTWDWYNFKSVEELTEDYRAFWSINRYDFVPGEEQTAL